MYTLQVPRITYNPGGTTIQPSQVPIVTYPYGYSYYGYAPMFLDLIFMMIFLVLPFMIMIPLFKSLTKAVAT